MKKDKAYKILATQEGISNSQAKNLIDRGLVYVANKKVMIARGELDMKTKFNVQKVEKVKVIFQDKDILVVDKPAFVNSDEITSQFKGAILLHRLDRETSGVLMFAKNEEFQEKAIEEFKKQNVYKEYVAWVDGVVTDELEIDKPILTVKKDNRANSTISKKGKPSHTFIYPEEVSGKKSLIKIVIKEGRTHQIRCHLRSVNLHIIGDEQYGGRRSKRVMLHARNVQMFDYNFTSELPTIFKHFSQ